jgi:hypothetical protein
MTAHQNEDRREDVPEADLAEQQRDLHEDETSPATPEPAVDPLAADTADQLEQATDVPIDDEDYGRPS